MDEFAEELDDLKSNLVVVEEVVGHLVVGPFIQRCSQPSPTAVRASWTPDGSRGQAYVE